MRVGLNCSGVGVTATGEFIKTAAQAAEQAGFATFYASDHVAIFEKYPGSKYPYADIAVHTPEDFENFSPFPDPATPMVDPIQLMAWAAAATTTIELGSAIIILPQRNPLVLAKELASLDSFSGGRVLLGAGVGWCKEEYDAVSAPWAERARAMDENLAALRTLWNDKVSRFHGKFVNFTDAYSYPKPVRKGGIPIVIGGESDAAIRRAARYGDGWLPFKLSTEDAPKRIERLRKETKEAGRNPNELRIIVGIFTNTSADDMKRYRDAGVTDFHLVSFGDFSADEDGIKTGIADLGKRFADVARNL